ncbi:MAG TPA: glycoside hydrolase family 2 TIM barrel-domain containing protein [Bacteroidales bacterium]|nr:glycoside hydrolase family 2 TIM barrel-domain containing protein [Bacteroidales bacterium]
MKRTSMILFLLVVCFSVFSQGWTPVKGKIMTSWGETLNPASVWQEYPRPQFERDDWMNLNGLWDYALLKKNIPLPSRFQGKILVPFCIESALSGVGKSMKPDDRLWYSREFEIPSSWQEKQVLLHFEAVDWSATVWVNDAPVGSHEGAYDRFTFDITPYLKSKGRQKLVVCVDDPSSSGTQARGKQQMPQQGIWYTPVSGIWQTVWLEPVTTEASLEEVFITPDIDRNLVSVIPMLREPKKSLYSVEVRVLDGEKTVSIHRVDADKTLEIPLENPRYWSPGDPHLYNLELILSNDKGQVLDRVSSYFGMRKISLGDKDGNKVLYLNNEFLFHYGTLDQGWWPDGLHTPPSDEAMRYDLEVTKQMGFNMIRKHIKVEPARWYYWCDKLGIMVWQDMPSGMVVIPEEGQERPVHVQHVPRNGEDLNKRSLESAQFEWELNRMIKQHYNHPGVVIWVVFNEGWGQYQTCRMADLARGLDPSRLINAVSGWALRPCGDIYDIHTYQVDVLTPPVSIDMASVIGEYGGIGYPVEGHLWDPAMRNWGYQTYTTAEELLVRYKEKFDQVLEMKRSKGLSAAVYTQTTDVEGEVNGLITYDRKVIKIPVGTLNDMHVLLYEK